MSKIQAPRESRTRIRHLESRRRKLLRTLLYPREMLRGALYQIRRSCGNPRCRCARGQKHVATCLSVPVMGQKKLVYVRRHDHEWVRLQAARYRNYQRTMAAIRKINAEVLRIVAGLRDAYTKMYE